MLCKKKLTRVFCYGGSAICLVTIVSLLCSINLANRSGRDFMQMLNIDQLPVTRIFRKIDDPRESTLQLTKNQTSANLIKGKESDQPISRVSSTSEVQKQHKEPVTDSHRDVKPFKFFIYDLPKKFNTDLVKCVIRYSSYRDCFDLTNQGMGKLLYHISGMAVTDSNQFSLEVIVHHQLLKSSMRTLNVSEADMFYIPAYMGLACFCNQRNNKVTNLVSDLYKYLNKQQPFLDLKPHFSTLSKIEREQASKTCSLLLNKESRKVTYIAIERETNERSRNRRGLKRQKIVVAPYPSYVHYDSRRSDNFTTPSVSERNVFVFMAASVRRTNPFRALLIDQFHNKTKDKYETFYKREGNRQINQVMLVTSECMSDHKYTTIPWMLHSTFCLQPPGDSPTRKSFYDSVLSGCIPVLFHYPSNKKNRVRYPFDWRFNYTDFTVVLPAVDGVDSYPDIYNTLENVPREEIERLHYNLDSVARYFQYSFIHEHSIDFEDSAMFYIMEELKQIHHIS